MFLFFVYSCMVLSVTNQMLHGGKDMSSQEFHDHFVTSRETVQNLQSVFMLLTVILGAVLSIFIWSGLPMSIKCILFNQYSVLTLLVVVLLASTWTRSEIAGDRVNTNHHLKCLNTATLTISAGCLFGYFLVFLNYHFAFME